MREMRNAAREAEVLDVDALLGEPKRLAASIPAWNLTARRTSYDASWTVEDVNGVARAQLRFNCRRSANPCPTIVLVWRSRPIWRIELADSSSSHRNPPWARRIRLPPIVSGPHEHRWPDNREHVRRTAPYWDIPGRRPLTGPASAGLPQALAAFASAINLTIDSSQSAFDVPPQGEMFP
jgi:hypothetical protein